MRTREDILERMEKIKVILGEKELESEIIITPTKRLMLRSKVMLLEWVLE